MGICKLVIKAYTDSSYSSEKGEFVSTINPTNLKILSNIDYKDSQMMGNPNWTLQYNISRPRILSFSLLFDNTGIFPNANIDVRQQVKSLEGLIASYHSDVNEPYFVRVIWGSIDFKGKLQKLLTNYTMFKNDGVPIRAQSDIAIIEYKQEEIAVESQKEIKEDTQKDKTDNSNTSKKNQNNNNTNKQAENKTVDENKANNVDDRTEAKNEIEETKQEEGIQDDNTEGENNQNEDNDQNEDNEGPNNEEEPDNNEDNNEENQEENNNEPENNENEENNRENNDNNNNNTPSETNPDYKDMQTDQVGAGDSLPSMMNNTNPNLPSMNSLIPDVGLLNGLDSLRDLALGALLALPLTIAALLGALLAKLVALAKKGVSYIKKKAKSGAKTVKDKAKSGAKTIKDKTKSGFNTVKNKTKNVKKKVTGK